MGWGGRGCRQLWPGDHGPGPRMDTTLSLGAEERIQMGASVSGLK